MAREAPGRDPPVAFATFEELPDGSPDDALAIGALARRGIAVTPAVWDDPSVDWGAFELVVVRSTWDYFRRPREFLRWVDRVARVTRLENPRRIVRWNAHKGYLLELAARGVDVVPSQLVLKGSKVPLGRLRARWPGAGLVVKPAYGGNAEGLFRVEEGARDPAAERSFEELRRSGDVIVQPFLTETPRRGERSFVFFEGKLSHAVEYRFVLEERNRSPRRFEPTAEELVPLARALALVRPTPLYARLDVLPAGGGRWWLGEMELIEPELLFRGAPDGAGRFASAIAARLSAGSADGPPRSILGRIGASVVSRSARPRRSPRDVRR